MKKYSPGNIMSALLIIMVAVTFYSCRKELNLTDNSPSNQTVVDAKDWYESSFPVNNSLKLTNAITESNSDLSQKIKPDWSHTSMYNRFGKEVIEMPIEEPTKFRSILKNRSTNRLFGRKEYNRSSYILLKQGGKYEAYIMTIIADSAYLKGDLTKLAKNTYNKRDPEFSGYVLYFTPKGKYVSGWQYKNGQLIVPGNSNKGINAQNLKTVNSKYKPLLKQTEVCVDWYWVTEDDNGQITSVTYMYSVCHYEYEADDNSGGGPSDAPPPPPICPDANPDPGNNPDPGHDPVQVSTYKGLGVAPWSPPPSDGGGGGGFPPPEPNPPCVPKPPVTDTINEIKDSCLSKMVDAALASGLDSYTAEMTNAVFGHTKDINITFKDDVLNSDLDGKTLPQGDPGTTGIFNADVTINTTLSSSSKEYIAATIIHEVTHAYMTFQGKLGEFNQHTGMATTYAYTLQHDLQAMFPDMSDPDAKALSWGGLQKTKAWTDLVKDHPNEAQSIIDINKSYKDAKGKKGKRC